jgi:hypothetical protein
MYVMFVLPVRMTYPSVHVHIHHEHIHVCHTAYPGSM